MHKVRHTAITINERQSTRAEEINKEPKRSMGIVYEWVSRKDFSTKKNEKKKKNKQLRRRNNTTTTTTTLIDIGGSVTERSIVFIYRLCLCCPMQLLSFLCVSEERMGCETSISFLSSLQWHSCFHWFDLAKPREERSKISSAQAQIDLKKESSCNGGGGGGCDRWFSRDPSE